MRLIDEETVSKGGTNVMFADEDASEVLTAEPGGDPERMPFDPSRPGEQQGGLTVWCARDPDDEEEDEDDIDYFADDEDEDEDELDEDEEFDEEEFEEEEEEDEAEEDEF